MNFKQINNIAGWASFSIALTVYLLTFEETASFWDSSEFIAASFKLEVPHPPGAPLYMLIAKVFSFLSFGDSTKVALWINFVSVLSSAFTILFLFWSISILSRRLLGISPNVQPTTNQSWVVIAASLVGSLAFTFSDSFWFSAVEAEVYAMSSLFTALVVWAMLKWSLIEDESKANRWLILIAYMMGLSIGVHLLNLVAIPALGLIYYFKKYKPSRLGLFTASIVSLAFIGFINGIIIPGLPSLAAKLEVFFVNSLGLPFGSGVFVFCVLLITGLVHGIYYSHKQKKHILNTFLLGTTFILIGYCSYATIVIRSNFDTPINQNAPKDVMSFIKYLNRDQYGSRPLIKGPYYTSQIVDFEYGEPIYVKGTSKYEISDRKITYIYDNDTIFPRAWDSQQATDYQQLLGLKEGEQPNFADNLNLMFRHQIGNMYLRYLLWNYAGRESDIQNAAWLKPSGWFGDLPEVLASNKARNNFFMIPLLLGVVGMFFQLKRDPGNFVVVGTLFIMLGVAIVVYLNSPPVEPRERDYIYVGSIYAFAIWIGLAVVALTELFSKIFRSKQAIMASMLLGLSAPALMAQQGWDDHNRSNRFFSVDSGKNYLDSCAPNSILFTGGDNDTFMLWYLQEVLGYRTDVRVVVLSYYNTDWYIEQTMKDSYDSKAFAYHLTLNQYRQNGPNDVIPYRPLNIGSIDARDYVNLLSQDDARLTDRGVNILPSKLLTLPIDKESVLSKNIIPRKMNELLVDEMHFQVTEDRLWKKDLALLDLIITNNWERPIYFNANSFPFVNFNLEPYLVQEGLAYRLLPVTTNDDNLKLVNTDVAYENMVNRFGYSGLDNPDLYFTNDYQINVNNTRISMNLLAEALLKENDVERARRVLSLSLEKMPDTVFPLSLLGPGTVDLLFQVGESKTAIDLALSVEQQAEELATYYIEEHASLSQEVKINLTILIELQRVLLENGEIELSDQFGDAFERHWNILQGN